MKILEDWTKDLGEKKDEFFEKYLFFLDKEAKKIQNVEDLNVVIKKLKNNLFKTEEKMKEKQKQKLELQQEQKSNKFKSNILYELF